MESNIVYSRVKNVTDKNPVKRTVNWDGFVEMFEEPELRGEMPLEEYLECCNDERKQLANEQKDGLAIIPGEFSKKGTKSKDDLFSRHLLVLDLDDGFYSFEELVEKLAGFRCIIHTSYSHSPEKGKYRVYIPFDKPVTEDIEGVCARAVDYFEHILGGHLDDKCRTVSQIYFTPSCPEDAGELYRFVSLKGKALKAVDYKYFKEVDRAKIGRASESTGNRPGDDFNKRGGWKTLLEELNWREYFPGKDGNAYFTRPGKTKGISGVVFPDTNVFYVFSSSPEISPFECGKAYSLFTAYTTIKHNGDASAAASQLRSEGYGDSIESGGNQGDAAIDKGISSFPEIEFPLEVFPENFQKLVVAYATAYQCQTEFMAMIFLTVLSFLAGNAITLNIRRKWQFAPFLWFYVIGATGDGKSPPENAAVEPVHALQEREEARFINEQQQYKQEIAAYKKDSNSKLPTEPTEMRHFLTNDFTMESLIPMFRACARGILLHFDELAGLFTSLNQYKGGKGSDNDRLLSLFDCKPLKVDRVGKTYYCKESGVAILGGIQPERLPQIFTKNMHENGMVYRFIPM